MNRTTFFFASALLLNSALALDWQNSYCGVILQAHTGITMLRSNEVEGQDHPCGTCPVVISCLNPRSILQLTVNVTNGMIVWAYDDMRYGRVSVVPVMVDDTSGSTTLEFRDGMGLFVLQADPTMLDGDASIEWTCAQQMVNPAPDNAEVHPSFTNIDGGKMTQYFSEPTKTRYVQVMPLPHELPYVRVSNMIGTGSNFAIFERNNNDCSLDNILQMQNRVGVYEMWAENPQPMFVVCTAGDPAMFTRIGSIGVEWGKVDM